VRPPIAGIARIETSRQLRIISQDRFDTDQDGVMLIPQLVRVAARLLTSDPFRVASTGRDVTVERHRILERDLWEALTQALQVAGIHLSCGFSFDPDRYVDSGSTQESEPASSYCREGIENGSNDTPDTGLNDGLDTGRRSSVVRTRLQGDVECRPTGSLPCSLERDDFRMRPSRRLGATLADHFAVAHDHRAHCRIRSDPPLRPSGKSDRTLHPVPICVEFLHHRRP
jgi:hypothetical protein